MLHYETVQPRTLGILRGLMEIPSLKDFYLVGGTAFSLQVGHRISVDIDLFRFSEENVDTEQIFKEINDNFSNVTFWDSKDYYLKCDIEGVKIDILRYRHPLIDDTLLIDGIRMVSAKDIAPMKLLAISNRGAKKDFYDLYFLLKQFSLDEMFGFYFQKFKRLDEFILYKSLSYFGNADPQKDLEILADVTWEEAKEEIRRLAKSI